MKLDCRQIFPNFMSGTLYRAKLAGLRLSNEKIVNCKTRLVTPQIQTRDQGQKVFSLLNVSSKIHRANNNNKSKHLLSFQVQD